MTKNLREEYKDPYRRAMIEGYPLFREGNYSEAIPLFDAVTPGGNTPDLYIDLARCYLEVGDPLNAQGAIFIALAECDAMYALMTLCMP
jgi:hypothetical protein